MSISIGDRIRQEIESDADKSYAACAKFAGLSKSTMSEIVNGRSKSSTKLHLIAEYLGVTTKWLETGKGPKQGDQGVAESRVGYGVSRPDKTGRQATPDRGAPRVLVRGTAFMDKAGFWTELVDDAEGNGYFSVVTEDPGAYFVRIRGGDAPMALSGWYVMLLPSLAPEAGMHVLVKLADGRSTIREFLWHRDGEYALQSPDGSRMMLLDRDVEFMHCVAGTMMPSQLKR